MNNLELRNIVIYLNYSTKPKKNGIKQDLQRELFRYNGKDAR